MSITPRTALDLFGHEAAQKRLMDDFASGKLAHGWLITGPQGIGKATLAHRFARHILSGLAPESIDAENPVYLRMAAGSHSDFLVIEPAFDTKKDEFARDINVDQAREIPGFLSMTPGEGKWRVVIIDAVDQLNINGANAILKILEEPPAQTILLLISHNPGRLLPTIRSRCRLLALNSLAQEQYRQVILNVAPEISRGDANILGNLTGFSPGIAIGLHELGAIELYNKMVELLLTLPDLNLQKTLSFAESISSGSQHANWKLFTRLMLSLMQRVVYHGSGVEVEAVTDKESQLLAKLADMHPVPVWAHKWQEAANEFMVAERLHLDYKQFALIFLHSITGREEFHIGSAAA